MAKVCIVCQKEVARGYPVQDDLVIHAIRSIKQRFNIAKNNELVVEEACLEEHKKKRERYEKSLVKHVVMAGVVLAVFVLMPMVTPAGFSLSGVLLGIALAAMIMALSVFYHWPNADIGKNADPKKPEERKTKKKK